MGAAQLSPSGRRSATVLRWTALLLTAAVTSLAIGFAVGLVRPRVTSVAHG